MRFYVPTTGIWKKCKKLQGLNKFYSYYKISGIIRIQKIENTTVEQMKNLVDLKGMFPDVDIDKLLILSIMYFSFIFICRVSLTSC